MKIRLLLCLLLIVTVKALAENNDNISNGVITGRSVNFRTNPTSMAEILRVLKKNEIVEILEIQESWYKIKIGEQTGWVYKDYVSMEPEKLKQRTELHNKAVEITIYARSYLGFKYNYGGSSPAGFDCSGFTMYIYDKFGYKLPHSAAAQICLGEKISRDDLVGGDLVFFATKGNGRISHVGIYLGDGDFIHASSRLGRIKINSLQDNYYRIRYCGGRRILSVTG